MCVCGFFFQDSGTGRCRKERWLHREGIRQFPLSLRTEVTTVTTVTTAFASGQKNLQSFHSAEIGQKYMDWIPLKLLLLSEVTLLKMTEKATLI